MPEVKKGFFSLGFFILASPLYIDSKKMEKELLYKLFSGRASDEEVTEIRNWTSKSVENEHQLYEERFLFDAILFNKTSDSQKSKTEKTFRRPFLYGSVAAILLLLLMLQWNHVFQTKNNNEAMLNTIVVPAGQRISLTLSDGSEVWLNSSSEISYPSSFDKNTRDVYLKGEAFFDVSKNADKKFVVHTADCAVEVLGTTFNIEAYDDYPFSASLLTGSVKILHKTNINESVILSPGQNVVFKNDKFVINPIKNNDFLSWKDGLIVFKNIEFEALMKKLEKNYGIQILIKNNSLKEYACSGKFRTSDSIDEILRVLQLDAGFAIEKVNDKIICIN